MDFRIRNMTVDDRAACREAEQRYRTHLDQFSKSANSDLWEFFYADTFHDGGVRSLEFGQDLRTVTMTVNCPNIRRLIGDDDFEYVDASFVCTFRNVFDVKFTVEPWHEDAVTASVPIYLRSEINTAPLLESLRPTDPEDLELSSLLIQLLGDDGHMWLELVFETLCVMPAEPAAFAIMQSDPHFDVPTYDAGRP